MVADKDKMSTQKIKNFQSEKQDDLTPDQDTVLEFEKEWVEACLQNNERRKQQLYAKYIQIGYTDSDMDALIKLLEPVVQEALYKGTEIVYLNKSIVTGPRWAVPHFFQKGCLSLIGGEKGGGKSTFVINLLVRNSLEMPLWKEGPVGDGRRSIYICLETSPNDARDKVLSAGGDINDIHIVTHVGEERVDLQNEQHIESLIALIKKRNYFAIVIDPIMELVLNAQNDNKLMRLQINAILDLIKDTDTILLGTSHLKKERGAVDETGAFRGSSELVNMARSVFRIYDKEDGESKILIRFQVNNSEFSGTGGIEFKIGTNPMKTDSGETVDLGCIEWAKFIKGPSASLIKLCKSDQPNKSEKKDYAEMVKGIIEEFIAEGKPLNTRIIKNLAKARGVSAYFLNSKLSWKELGYYEKKEGKGGNFKVILAKDVDDISIGSMDFDIPGGGTA